MNTQKRLPYLLLNVGTSAPGCCVIHLNGTDQRPSIRRTMYWRPGEDDYAFWNRVEAEARQLADPLDLYPRSGFIDFDYGRTFADDDGGAADSHHNRRMELHFWSHSDNAEIRVMAATALGEMCGLFAPADDAAPRARH